MSNTILEDLIAIVDDIQDTYMLKSDYDIDENSVVDEAESIDGGDF